METRRLGRTGLLVSELGFGAAHVGASPEGEEALLTAFSAGVNFVETGRPYKGSEYLIGSALRQFGRGACPVRVASKTLGRSRDAALRDLERSLQHLRLDSIDIYQLCSVGDQDWERVMSGGGAFEGLTEARESGLIRFIGISSHSLGPLWKSVRSGLFDTIQVMYSAFDPAAARLIRSAQRRDIGVIAMKPLGGFGMPGSLRGSSFEGRITPQTLIGYVLADPGVSVTVPGMKSPDEVLRNLQAVTSLYPTTLDERMRLRRLCRGFLNQCAHPGLTAPLDPRHL